MELNITKNICRACLTQEGSFQSVFLKKSSLGVSINISEMLTACAAIQVKEEDGLPDQICLECSEQTGKLYLFKLKCEKNDIILRERLEKNQAEAVKIKNEFDSFALNENLISDFKNDKFNREIDKELRKKSEEDVSFEFLNENNKINELKSNICHKFIKQSDLLTNQKLIKDIKVEKLEIIDEDIEIKCNYIGSLFTESKKSIFPCPECDFVFVEKGNLEKHISDLHIKKEPEMSCDKSLKKGQQFEEINSFLENNSHGCKICFKDKQPSISNTVCNKEFYKTYECDTCEKKFTRPANLLRHKRIHTGEKPFECEVCKKIFTQSEHLAAHKRIHTGEKPYECEICKNKFRNSSALRSHEIIHTGERHYRCDVCEMKFARSSYLKYHKITHMGEKPFECDVCKKIFSQSGHLREHKKTHTGEKPYECEMCKNKFAKSSDLRRHKITHTGEKPFECDVCKKIFSQSGHLTAHKRSHTGEKPFKCKICEKQFGNSSSLRRHKIIHMGKKRFKCDVSKKIFGQSENLTSHKSTHTGEKCV